MADPERSSLASPHPPSGLPAPTDGPRTDGARTDGSQEPMKTLVESIIRALVDHPEQVQIHEVHGNHAHVLELRVAKDDLGKVIGKHGSHATAIRTLMAAASGKDKRRYILEILETS